MKLKPFIRQSWPYWVTILFIVAFFWKFFINGLLPIPADITVGMYFPWLDYKWGFVTGVPVKNPLLSDIPSILIPWRWQVIDQLKSGIIPLWNPYYLTGMPLLANFQSAVFSYANIFFLFFSKPIAWSLGVILQPTLAIFFTYLFLRNRNLSQVSSLAGGVVFAFCGFSTVWMEYNTLGHTALFLPLLLFVIDKYFQSRDIKRLFLFPFLIAFQIFAGYPPIVIYSYLIIGFFLYFFYKSKPQEVIKILFFWVLGLILAAVQLIPSFELLHFSVRSTDLLLKNQISFFPLQHFVTVLVPDFFGNPATGNWWGKGFYDNFSFYTGSIPLILVLLAILNIKKDRFSFFAVITLIFSFIMIVQNPIGEFLNNILGLRGGMASRALFITDFSLALLAATGAEVLLKEKQFRNLLVPLVIEGFAFVIIFLTTVFINDDVHKIIAQRNFIVPVIFYFLAVPLFWVLIFIHNKTIKFVLSFMVLLLIAGNLWYSTQKYLSFSESRLLFPETPIIDFLKKQDKPFRIESSNTIPPNFLMVYGLESVSGYDTLLPRKIGELLVSIDDNKVNKNLSRVILLRNYNSPIFPLLNVKYILLKKAAISNGADLNVYPFLKYLGSQYELVFEDKSMVVLENKTVIPRFSIFHQVEIRQKELLDRLFNASFDVTRTLLLEESVDLDLRRPAGEEKIVVTKYEPQGLDISIEAKDNGLLLLTNNYYPGWKSFIDGKETKIYRADYAFMAIAVSRGRHTVNFIYDPLSFKIGLCLSLGTLILLIITASWAWLIRKK